MDKNVFKTSSKILLLFPTNINTLNLHFNASAVQYMLTNILQ